MASPYTTSIILAVVFGNMAVYWLESAYVSSKTNKKQVIKLGYITGSASPNFTGSYYPKNGYYNRPGTLISGALTFALEQVNRNSSVLPNHTLEFIIAETYGQEGESIKQTALLLNKGIAAYIGPQETCVHEGRIAAAFNLPMISYVSNVA